MWTTFAASFAVLPMPHRPLSPLPLAFAGLVPGVVVAELPVQLHEVVLKPADGFTEGIEVPLAGCRSVGPGFDVDALAGVADQDPASPKLLYRMPHDGRRHLVLAGELRR